jgi:hypothetical protein
MADTNSRPLARRSVTARKPWLDPLAISAAAAKARTRSTEQAEADELEPVSSPWRPPGARAFERGPRIPKTAKRGG